MSFVVPKDLRDAVTDLTRQTFGAWTVIGEAPRTYKTNRRLYCRCVCGVEVSVQLSNLRSGTSRRCQDCYHRSHTKPVSMRLVRQMREHEGATWAKVARRLGISERALMQRVKGDGLRGTSWVRQNWSRLKDLRAHGATWRQIWLGNENPYATHNTLARAACEEFARRWARKYRDAVAVWELTRAGKPAHEIAGLVGVTERTVVRYRGHAPWYPQGLDLERALKLKARGLNWLEVNARMGRPCRNGTMLGLAVDMLLEARDRFELG